MQRLQENNSSDCVRGPHLANIEIERQRCLNGNPNNIKLMEALVKYFHRFVLVNLFPVPLSAVVYFESLHNMQKFLVLFKKMILVGDPVLRPAHCTHHHDVGGMTEPKCVIDLMNPVPVSSQLERDKRIF